MQWLQMHSKSAVTSSQCSHSKQHLYEQSKGFLPGWFTQSEHNWLSGAKTWWDRMLRELCTAAQHGTELSVGFGNSAVLAEHGTRKRCSFLSPPAAGSAYPQCWNTSLSPDRSMAVTEGACLSSSTLRITCTVLLQLCTKAPSSGANPPPATSESFIPSGEVVFFIRWGEPCATDPA